MKIDAIDKQHGVPPQVKSGASQRPPEEAFGDVFDKSMSASRNENVDAPPSIASPVASIAGLHHPVAGPEVASAAHLINALEHYQRHLSNPAVNLKMLEPMVQTMQQAASDAQDAAGRLDASSSLRSIVDEAVMTIRLEIERYTSGYYVDE